jgi:hypothetical protein
MESSEEPSRILIVLYGLIALSPIYVRGVCRCRANKDCIRERRAWTIANDRHSKSANQRIRRLWGVGRLNTTREIREISIIKNARLDATLWAHLKKKRSGHHTRHPNHQTNRLQASLYVEVATCGCSEYLCASHDEIIAGMKPERPWKMNCTTPLSGPRKPCSNSPATNPAAPTISIRTS